MGVSPPAAGFAPGVLGATTNEDTQGNVGIGEERLEGEVKAVSTSDDQVQPKKGIDIRNWIWVVLPLLFGAGVYLYFKKFRS
ncbi:hypothetical protein HYS92_00650 [Candidatus Daviesbacteria bacterium]|nr:hypothetical protein [Candidatus Daviesbacteria bacterium]